jgi:hypothetical protein
MAIELRGTGRESAGGARLAIGTGGLGVRSGAMLATGAANATMFAGAVATVLGAPCATTFGAAFATSLRAVAGSGPTASAAGPASAAELTEPEEPCRCEEEFCREGASRIQAPTPATATKAAASMATHAQLFPACCEFVWPHAFEVCPDGGGSGAAEPPVRPPDGCDGCHGPDDGWS